MPTLHFRIQFPRQVLSLEHPSTDVPFGGGLAQLQLRPVSLLPHAHRYVQSLLDIMEFLDKDPEDQRTLNQ
jgi:hypothetical protein